MKSSIDDLKLIGQKFGRLTVLELAPRRKGNTVYKVRCDCGTEKTVDRHPLLQGKTRSCGCLRQERLLSQNKNKDSSFQRLFKRYIKSAEKRGLEFKLTKEEFIRITKTNCNYCGEKPRQVSKNSEYQEAYIYNGIDRLDNNHGYTIENSVACCIICNYAKHTMGYWEFMEWIRKIAKYNKDE